MAKETLNEKLRKAGVNNANLSMRMKITTSLFEWRYNKPVQNYQFLVSLVKALDLMIYELIQIRDQATKEAWELSQEAKKKIEEVEKIK